MTDSKIQAAKKLLASGTPPHEVAHSLGVSEPTATIEPRFRWKKKAEWPESETEIQILLGERS